MFVTTHWDQVEFERGKAREAQIQKVLKSFLDAGAGAERFDKKTNSAWRIVESLVNNLRGGK